MAWTPSPAALAAITAGVVLAGAGAATVMRLADDPPAPALDGPGVSIALVAPREPEPEPGGVMDVGDLTDGYTHRNFARPVLHSPPPIDEGEVYAAAHAPPPRPGPVRIEPPRVALPEPAPTPVVAERPDRPGRWPFGFDQPRPDYAAERRERMARLEDQRRFEEDRLRDRYEDDFRPDDRRPRERQWYRSDGSRAPERDPSW